MIKNIDLFKKLEELSLLYKKKVVKPREMFEPKTGTIYSLTTKDQYRLIVIKNKNRNPIGFIVDDYSKTVDFWFKLKPNMKIFLNSMIGVPFYEGDTKMIIEKNREKEWPSDWYVEEIFDKLLPE